MIDNRTFIEKMNIVSYEFLIFCAKIIYAWSIIYELPLSKNVYLCISDLHTWKCWFQIFYCYVFALTIWVFHILVLDHGLRRFFFLNKFAISNIPWTIGNLTWYRSRRTWVWSLSSLLYLPFKISCVWHHLLKGNWSPHVRGSVRSMWLND